MSCFSVFWKYLQNAWWIDSALQYLADLQGACMEEVYYRC